MERLNLLAGLGTLQCPLGKAEGGGWGEGGPFCLDCHTHKLDLNKWQKKWINGQMVNTQEDRSEVEFEEFCKTF